ncbi:MAG: IS200/IS605 family transposase [Chloroflexi bacterium]|nr:IS200/IS605 family transposase [Chloroflexota bacterium]
MPQSLSAMVIHVVFSTKYRQPCLTPVIQAELHPYLAGIINNLGCYTIQVGGVEDHVHLLFYLSRTLTMAKIVEVVKTNSSKWLKTKSPDLTEFHWQIGYGAFSVSQSDVARVIDYILNQEEHHRQMSFQDEYRRLLDRYLVQYDEKYVWD